MKNNRPKLELIKSRFPLTGLPFQSVVLINGQSALIFTSDRELIKLKLSDLFTQTRSKKACLFLLAAPYVYSMVQQTIVLKSNELNAADNQILELSRFSKENRIIESFSLSNQKAVTIFSHLSEEGNSLIKELRQSRKRYTWKPAISALVNNLLDFPQAELHHYEGLEIIMEQELFSLKWKTEIPKIKHCFYWIKDQDANIRTGPAKSLVREEKENSILKISLISQHESCPQSIESAHQIFMPIGNRKGLKKARRKFKKRRLGKLKTLSPVLGLVLLTVCLLFLSIFKQRELYLLKKARTQLHKSYTTLNDQTDQFADLATTERSIMRIESMIDSIDQNQLKPQAIVSRIEALIPETSWLKFLKISRSQMSIEIFDRQRIDISKLIESFGKEFGEIELEENTTIQIEETLLRKYRLTIKPVTIDEQTSSLGPG
jgi:hypothetical protein